MTHHFLVSGKPNMRGLVNVDSVLTDWALENKIVNVQLSVQYRILEWPE